MSMSSEEDINLKVDSKRIFCMQLVELLKNDGATWIRYRRAFMMLQKHQCIYRTICPRSLGTLCHKRKHFRLKYYSPRVYVLDEKRTKKIIKLFVSQSQFSLFYG